MNSILILMGVFVLIGVAYSLLRTSWSLTEDGLIKGDPGTYYEPWRYYLSCLFVLGGAIFLIVLGLIF
jgi:hypothetical protein